MPACVRRHARRLVPLLGLSIGWAAAPASAPVSVAMGAAGPSATTVGYTLAGTWSDVPAWPGPGRFADAGDIAATPDGTLLVLDRHHNAVHVLAPGGVPRAIWPNPVTTVDGGAWQWVRLDTGFDGAAHVLARGTFAREDGPPETRWRVDILDGAGARARWLDLGVVAPERFVDLAVHPDGRIYLTRTNGNVVRSGTYAIDVFDPTGTRLRSLVPPQLTIPINLDVAADGTLYVVDQWPHTGAPGPGSGKVDGVAIFGPDEVYRETAQFSGAMDVAVGPAGVFVSRDNGVYALRSRQPLYAGPTVQKSPYRLPALGTPTMFSLAVPAAGPARLVAAMTHCTFQGVVAFADAGGATATPVFHGALDLPMLRGPVYPLRAAFGSRLALLQGRFEPAPAGATDAPFTSQLYTTHPQTVQHWRTNGDLRGQLGLCGMWNAPQAYADVAADGDAVYSIDHQLISYRPDDHPPAWETYALELSLDVTVTPHLSGVAADGGQAAVLDVGSAAVLVVDDAGRRVAAWPYAAGSHDPWAPTDIAMAGDRVVLASGGDGALRAFTRGGDLEARWVAPRPLRGVALAPGGDVVALDRFGWAYHYAIDAAPEPGPGDPPGRARLLTAWPMPDPTVLARDVAVDPAGRVYVPWVDLAPVPDAVDVAQRVMIRRAGVWVFQPSRALGVADAPVLTTTGRFDCLVGARTAAEPRTARPGAPVAIEHRVDGACTGAPAPARLVIVFNASESMNTDNGLERAKVGLIDLVGRLDPARVELALIAFAGDAALQTACPAGPADVRPAVANLVAAGGTDWSGALALAEAALACPGGRPDAGRRVVLMVTDGARPDAGDDPAAALAALRAQGVEIYSQIHPFTQITPDDVQAAVALAGGTDRAFTAHTPEGLDRQANRLAGRATVVDVPFTAVDVGVDLAPDVDFVAGSAEPPAVFDPAARTLRWPRMSVAGPTAGVVVRYRVTPRRAGSWVPVLRTAAAELTGGATADRHVAIPRPALHVPGAGEALLPWNGRP